MEEKRQKKSGGLVAIVILLLIVTIASVILATYAWAKYTTTVTGDAQAQVAKWNVTFDGDDAKFKQTYQHVLSKKMAPGTSGSFDATIAINDTEVDVDYRVSIVSIDVDWADNAPAATYNPVPTGTELTGTTLNRPQDPLLPKNLIFKNSAGTVIDVTGYVNTTPTNPLVIAYSPETGHIGPASVKTLKANTSGTGDSVTISNVLSWEWPYGNDFPSTGAYTSEQRDEDDTMDGAFPVAITVNYQVEAWQVRPVGPTPAVY